MNECTTILHFLSFAHTHTTRIACVCACVYIRRLRGKRANYLLLMNNGSCSIRRHETLTKNVIELLFPFVYIVFFKTPK